MTPTWKDVVRRGSIDELQHFLATGTDVDARDEHGQTALMLAAVDGRDRARRDDRLHRRERPAPLLDV
jgi:ankyrin repeat protein